MFSIVAALRTLFLPYGLPITQPQIIINEDPIRPELQTLYSNRVISDFIYQKGRFDYVYQALVSPLVGKPFLAFGGEESVSLIVTEAMRIRAGSPIGVSTLDGNATVGFSGQIFTETTVPRGYIDAMTSTAGILATSAGAEQVIASASYSNEPTFNFLGGQVYELMLTTGAFPNVATDSVTTVKIRKGQATLVGNQLAFWQLPLATSEAATVGTHTHVAYVQNPSINTVSTKLSITNQRANGAANLSLFGDANIPIVLTVKHVGRINDQGGLSLIAASVV